MRDLYVMKNGNHEVVGYAYTMPLDGGMFAISKIFVVKEHRGRGHGDAIMRLICRDADRRHCTLMLSVDPDPDTNYERLEKLYKRHGFETLLNSDAMIRRFNVRKS